MKPVIDQLLQEATILRVITERPGSPLGRAQKKVTAAKREKSDVGQEAEKLGLVWKGGRAYGKTADGPTLATSIKGKLVFTDEETEKKLKGGELKDQPDDKNTARDDQSADGSDLDVFSDKPSKKKKKEKTSKSSSLTPATEPLSDKEADGFHRETYKNKPPRALDWDGKKGSPNNTPNGKPPSDAEARQTAIDTGFPKSGTKPWPVSQITGQPAAPAPGTAGSMMNEIFSVEGVGIAEKFYEKYGRTPTPEDIAKILDKQYGQSALAEQNGAPDSAEYEKKLRIAAEASVTKFERLRNGEANNSETDPAFGEMIRPPSEFYGAGDSIEAQAQMIRDMPEGATIFGPDGPINEITNTPKAKEELISAVESLKKKKAGDFADLDDVDAYVENLLKDNTNKENIKKFAEILAYAGGGGANPSDTATFARSEDGNLMILFHSDKMETSDQQANSTMGKETQLQEEYINESERNGEISTADAAKARKVMETYKDKMEEIKKRDDAPLVAKRLLNFSPKQKKKIFAAVEKYAATKKPNPIEKVGFKGDTEGYLNYIAGLEKTTSNEGKTVNRVLGEIKNDPDFTEEELVSIDATTIGSEKTAQAINAMAEKRRALDKIKTSIKDPDGNYRGLGQVTEARNIINKLHFYAADDPSQLAYQSGMCATVIGRDVVNREILRESMGIESSDELLSRLVTGSPKPPEDDYVDEDTGLPNSLLQRSTSSFERDKDSGKPYFWLVNSAGKITGKTIDPDEEGVQKTGKGEPVKVGVPTGEKIDVSFVNKEGKRFNVSSRSGRSKSGPGGELETAYTYGKSMQNYIKTYGNEETNESISYRHIQTLLEMASKV
tara:strand:- start:10044 stop:12563 length:2520 start_codon:yes stop_codon:yes gene_type:complete